VIAQWVDLLVLSSLPLAFATPRMLAVLPRAFRGGLPMVLDKAAVRGLLSMEEVISAMDQALASFSSGKVVQPVRTMLPVSEYQGFLGLMPAYRPVSSGPNLWLSLRANAGLPTHHAIIQLFRPETGEPLAAIDGRLITEMRTAAV
jgi:alanine dehydrogenase